MQSGLLKISAQLIFITKSIKRCIHSLPIVTLLFFKTPRDIFQMCYFYQGYLLSCTTFKNKKDVLFIRTHVMLLSDL